MKHAEEVAMIYGTEYDRWHDGVCGMYTTELVTSCVIVYILLKKKNKKNQDRGGNHQSSSDRDKLLLVYNE